MILFQLWTITIIYYQLDVFCTMTDDDKLFNRNAKLLLTRARACKTIEEYPILATRIYLLITN